VLRLPETSYREIIGHVYDGYPYEACGLLGGRLVGAAAEVDTFYATDNDARSARVYTIPPDAHLRAERDAERRGAELVGVVHSHTHTDAYPSPTDVTHAPDPTWHYVIVSLRDNAPVMRSYRIVDGTVSEELVVVERP